MKKTGRYISIYFVLFLMYFIIIGTLIDNSGNNNDKYRFDKQNNEDYSNYTGEITIVINKEDELLREYTDEFNRQYPDLKINFTILSDYENELYKYMNNNDNSDILLIPNFIEYKELDKYFEPLGNIDSFSRLYNFAETKSLDNVVYGLPINANANGIVYNKKVFEESGILSIPKTIDEFMEDLYLIRDNTDAIPLYTNYNSGWTLSEWEDFCYGAMTGDSAYRTEKFINEENQFLKGTPHYEVYKLLYDIVKNGLCESNPLSTDWESSKKMMNEGKIACMALDSWSINQIKKAGPNSDDIGYMAFPNNINGVQSITVTSDYCYGINVNSKNKEAAKAWINFIINESSYVLDNENISILKSDTLPDSLNNLNDCKLIVDNDITGENMERYLELSKDLNLNDYREQQKIIEAALSNSNNSFDDIMKDWNKRLESNRTIPRENYSKEISVNLFIKKEGTEKELSENEKSYIKNYKDLKIGYIEEHYPIQYKNKKNGEFSGIVADVFKFIEDDTGLNFDYIPCNTEMEAVEKIKTGDIDMIAGLESSNFNELENITLSKDYLDLNNIMIKNKNVDINGIDDWNMALEKGSISYYKINSNNISYYDTFEECLKSVNKGKMDYTYGNFYSTSYYTRVGDYDNLVIVPMTDDERKVSVAFSKFGDRKIISIINKSIYNLSKEKMQSIIYDNTEKNEDKISISKFIKSNYLLCTVIILIVNIVIVAIIGYIIVSKIRYTRNIALANKKYEQLSDLSDEYIFEFDYKSNTVYFSIKFQEYFRYPKSVNLNLYDEKDKHINEFITNLKKMKSNNCDDSNVLYSVANGKKEWFKVIYSTINDDDNNPINIIGKLINIDREMSERNMLLDTAFHDQLTGVYNRAGFRKKINEYIKVNRKKYIALFILDMDGFKEVNDTLGHQEGDKLLIILGENLRKVFGDKNIIGRWGGDEFLVGMIENVSLSKIEKKAEQMCQLMNMEFGNSSNKINVSLSIGICYSMGNIDFDKVFEKADKALYEIKKNGKNNYHIYKL